MAQRSLLLLAIILGAFFITTSMALEEAPNECDPNFKDSCHDRAKAMKLKIIAIFVILVASMAGIALPQLSLKFPSFSMEKPLFFIVKAFASGVILSTGFMHVLPDSLANLESECLPDNPWHKFPFTTFIAMVSAVGTLMMDSFSMAVHHKRQRESSAVHASPSIHIHAHGHGHSLPVSEEPANKEGEVSHTLKRNRVIAMVLEIGIVVHSVIIGLSMGASQSPCTIKPLVVAICFHQFFEGMGLGGCILQAEYKLKTKSIMIFFFSVTTPLGIVLGIGVSNIYSDNSPTALIVLGVLNACSAGLLIYMALVDLLAADFMGKKLQESLKIQGWAYVAVFLGMGFMSLMAKWA